MINSFFCCEQTDVGDNEFFDADDGESSDDGNPCFCFLRNLLIFCA